MQRCAWPSTPLDIEYHDREWGVPVHDDRVLFEFLTLEGAQAGHFRDANRPPELLTPLDDHTFALGEASRVDFVREGNRVTAMRVTTPSGQTSTFPRSP